VGAAAGVMKEYGCSDDGFIDISDDDGELPF